MSKKVILVTGGMGYIGSHGVVAFEQAGYKTVIVDNLSNSQLSALDGIEQILGYKPDFFELDLRNKKGLEEVFKKYDFHGVLHFAGAKSPFESQQDPLHYYDNNISGSLHLFDIMNRYNVKNIIFSSSANVYSSANISPVDENGTLGPNNPYGRTKYLLEQILEDLHKFSSFNVIHLRYFNPIGSHTSGFIGEHLDGIPNNIFPYIMKVAAKKIEKLKVFGGDYNTVDGSGVRDYIDINDLVHGHLLAYNFLTKRDEPIIDIFNLGTGSGLSVLELIGSIEKELDMKINYEMVGRRDGDLAEVYCDTSKANKILGFQSRFTLKESITNTWKFYNEELYEK